MVQSLPGRGLDRYRLAGHHRGCTTLGRRCRNARFSHDHPAMNFTLDDLEFGISRAVQALIRQQRDDGHWVFELEADATIPSEYVLLRHYLGEPDDLELERKIGVYLRRIQRDHGGWPLFHGGAFDLSASVKAYFC